MTYKRFAIAVLVCVVIYKAWAYAQNFVWPYLGARWLGGVIGGTVADPRVWLLVIGILLLNWREKKKAKVVSGPPSASP